MAELKPKTINELPTETSPTNDTLIPVSSGGSSKKLSFAVLSELLKADNGDGYIKFPDGTMICYAYALFENQAFSDAWGALYSTPLLSLPNWPVPFVRSPETFVSPYRGTVLLTSVRSFSATSAGQLYAVKPDNSASTFGVSVFGIGRWK